MIIFRPITKTLPEAVKYILAGEVIAAPTETAYGLLADATNQTAVSRVFKIKSREKNKVSALLVADLTMAKKYGYFSKTALALAKNYWPGPLTIVVPVRKNKLVKAVVYSDYVGMRVPHNRWLQQLLLKVNKPLTATSANLAGRPLCYSAAQVKKQLGRSLKVLVNSGQLPQRKVSTLVKVSADELLILRLGAVSLASLKKKLGRRLKITVN